jgi:hypothetical protein
MHQKSTDSATEIKRLQRCMNDLVSVLALPAVWSVSEPSRILETLLDALMETLDLDFLYARIRLDFHGAPVDALMGILDLDFLYARVRLDSHGDPIESLKTTRLSGTSDSREEIRQALRHWYGEDPQQWPEEVLGVWEGRRFRSFP